MLYVLSGPAISHLVTSPLALVLAFLDATFRARILGQHRALIALAWVLPIYMAYGRSRWWQMDRDDRLTRYS